MSDPQLAQCSIAKIRAPLDSPQFAEFAAALDPINALAVANMSVWESPDARASLAQEVR